MNKMICYVFYLDVLKKVMICHVFIPVFLQNCKGRFDPVIYMRYFLNDFPIFEAMVQNRYRSSRVLLASKRP